MTPRWPLVIFLSLVSAGPLLAQGIMSGGVVALPRPKASGRPWPVQFTDITVAAGIQFRFTSGNEFRKKYVIEANGSGVAMLDYNDDGRQDLFLVNGSRLGAPPAGATNRLYRNDGAGRFTDVTKDAHLDHAGWGNGVCTGDVDNDGHLDLYLTYFGSNVYYRNRGDATFDDLTAKAGIAGTGKQWSTGCSFFDYDRDGHLDLIVARYLEFEQDKIPLPGAQPFCRWRGEPVYCGPRGLPYGGLTLYHNKGDGTFEDVSAPAGIDAVRNFYAFTVLAADLSGDGWPDIYVACDSTPSILLRNEKDGTFRDVGAESGLAFNEHGAEQAGMGAALGDFDNDGRLDVTKTNFSGDYPNLYWNDRGIFSDIAVKAGLAINPDHVLWGTAFADFDNDGWQDLFQVSGHVYPEIVTIEKGAAYKRPRLLYRNLGNRRFEDVSSLSGPGITQAASSRGAAFGDIDNDGDIDVLVMNMHEAPSLLRNEQSAPGNWIEFQLQGTRSNRAAIGAIVRVKGGGSTRSHVVLSQTSFLSVNDLRAHFGLGSLAGVDQITVEWPSGRQEDFGPLPGKALYRLTEGAGKPERLALPR